MLWGLYYLGGAVGILILLRFLLPSAYLEIKTAIGFWNTIKTITYHSFKILLFSFVVFLFSWVCVSYFIMNYSFLKDELEQMMRTENMGSSLAIFLGILFIFIYISASKAGPPQNPEHLFLGIMIIPGALVYRSAKKRKQEEAKNTKKRRITEWAALSMILCFAILILVSTNGFAIERMPVLFFLAVPWILISYIVVIIKSPKLIK